MLEENKRIRAKIAQPFEQLILFRLNQLDASIQPGCTSLTWVSPNVESYIDTVFKSLDSLDLILNRANDLVTYRIEAVLNDMANAILCDITEDEPIAVEEFLRRTEELCNQHSTELQFKSKNVEDAAQELIDMLYPADQANEEDNENSQHNGEEAADESGGGAGGDDNKPSSHRDLNSRHSAAKVPLTQAQIQRKKRREQRALMDEHAKELLNYFSHKNLDAIIKLIKSTLEKIRKRITSSQTVNYSRNEKVKKETPVFKCYAILAIPNITMQPALDEVQQSLNKAVQLIIGVSKHISLWSKERRGAKKAQDALVRRSTFNIEDENEDNEQTKNLVQGSDLEGEAKSHRATEDRPASPTTTVQTQKNYYKSVSDNKEITKIVQLLLTCINSTKKDVVGALDRFKNYQYIWQKDRDEDLKEFLQQDVRVSEFEVKIRGFEKLIEEINTYPEFIPIGAIALATERLKLGLITEIGLWKQHYGQACNQLYKKEMNNILLFVEDIDKRLQRPIKDLDDIRLAMQALKEIRDNEIKIDMTILPVEESYAMLVKHEIDVHREEVERCDTLRYNWQKLMQLASQTSSTLLDIQPRFRGDLSENVKEFVSECNNYYSEYYKVSFRLFFFEYLYKTEALSLNF